MNKATVLFLVCAGLLALLMPRTAAAWPDVPNVNVPLCVADATQQSATSVTDGAGGAIVTWQDSRSGTNHIYAQCISADGTPLWTANGVAICTATNDQFVPTIVSDGAGGAIVAWHDSRSGNFDIYAQKISGVGAVQWTADGVALCTATDNQGSPAIASDGAGGAIVTWQDFRSGTNNDIYAQRISAVGTPMWTANGVALCTAAGHQYYPVMVSDGAGGAIVAWYDYRDYGSTGSDIYAQKISAIGAVQWTANGTALCTAIGHQLYPAIVSDGAGGSIVTWQDSRSSGDWDIYTQRISTTGSVPWAADGVALCTIAGSQLWPTIVADGAGGAIVNWEEYRNGDSDIYSQGISTDGTPLWTADGVALCATAGNQNTPQTASDGAGGAIVTWGDYRSGGYDVYARRISAGGTPQWTANGAAICTATGNQYVPIIVSDDANGAIVIWQDSRNGNPDIYAQRVWADGTTPVQLSLASADVTADGVKLAWFMGGSTSSVATVYRSPVGGEWTRVGEVTADGTGYLRYTDPIDATSTRVGYRLGIVEAGVEGFYGETWVELPARDAALAFALDPVRPNPTQGGALTVHFTLPSAAPARVELVDVSGRRIVEREVGSLGAGPHALDLGEGRRLAPGLYLVRLTQGTNTRVTRVAVL